MGFKSKTEQKEIREKKSKGSARRLKRYQAFKAKLPGWKAKHKAAVKAEKEKGVPDPKKVAKKAKETAKK